MPLGCCVAALASLLGRWGVAAPASLPGRRCSSAAARTSLGRPCWGAAGLPLLGRRCSGGAAVASLRRRCWGVAGASLRRASVAVTPLRHRWRCGIAASAGAPPRRNPASARDPPHPRRACPRAAARHPGTPRAPAGIARRPRRRPSPPRPGAPGGCDARARARARARPPVRGTCPWATRNCANRWPVCRKR